MPTTFQPPLLIEPSAEVTLVSLDSVGAERGWHIDRVNDWALTQWVFDLGFKRNTRTERRVWIACLRSPEIAAAATDELVIESVIGSPTQNALRGAALETRWRISGITLSRLRKQGEIDGSLAAHSWWYSRSSLRSFLQRRLVR